MSNGGRGGERPPRLRVVLATGSGRPNRNGDVHVGIDWAAVEQHNRNNSREDAMRRMEDYEKGWVPESVRPPMTPQVNFKWVRVVHRLASRTGQGMSCFAGSYMAEQGLTSITPGDVVIFCTDTRLLHTFVFLMHGEWYSIDHLPVSWTGDWAQRIIPIIEPWLNLPRTLRIFRACNEGKATIEALINDNPELAEDALFSRASDKYIEISKVATRRTGSLTLPLVEQTLKDLIKGLARQTNTDRDTVVNLLSTVLEEISTDEALRRRKIVEFRIEGLDQLINAVMLIFGADIRQGSAVTVLHDALSAVQHNARELANWIGRTDDVTAQAWNQVAQRSADRKRQLTRFNLRKRKEDNADRPTVPTDHS